MSEKEQINKSYLPEIAIAGVIFTFVLQLLNLILPLLSLLADVEQLGGSGTVSEWLKSIYLIFAQPRVSLVLNVTQLFILILVGWLAYSFYRSKKSFENLHKTEQGKRNNLEKATNLDRSMMRALVERLIVILVNSHSTPSLEKSISELSLQLIERLPSEKAKLRLSVAIPLSDGRFKIIWSYNITDERKIQLEAAANWRKPKTYFAEAFWLDLDEKNFLLKRSDSTDKDYFAGKPEETYIRSKVHFIIPVKSKLYNEEFNDGDCLAVVTISSPESNLIPEGMESEFYYSVYNPVRAMEIVLLQYRKLSDETGSGSIPITNKPIY